MAKKKASLSTNNIVTCALYVVIGILLCVMRIGMLNILMTVLGVLFIAKGIYDILTKNLTVGIAEAVIGVVIIVCGWTIATWVLLVFGVLIIVKGVLDLFNVLKRKKKGLMDLLAPIVTIVVGILLCVAPFAIGDIICIIAGVVFIINGVLALFGRKLA